jgi:diguanylate cyclase (GGDEF)-like protein
VHQEQSNTDRATVIAGPDQDQRERPPRLIVVAGTYLGHQIELGALPVVVGRAAEATLSLPHPSISRSHCRIWREGEHFYIEDLGSTNKTYLNGQAVMRAELKDGDQIGIGNHSLKFFSSASPEAQYHQNLIEMAVHDGLTGFFNRRHFRTLLDECVDRARAGEALAVVIIDLDHFKRINDHFGHLVGDQVLQTVAQLIRQLTPGHWRLGRLGGEEFAAALPGATLADACAYAETLRTGVEQHHFDIRGERHPITTSLGVAGWASAMSGSADLLRLADERLYRAKANGRNRVEHD